ncbi:MAG: type IV pilus assembly protein PilM [Bacillota bacterium]
MLDKIKSQFQRKVQKGENFLGIDIGTREIKMIEMAPKSQTYINKIGRASTPSGALDDGTIIQVDQVAKAIRTMWEEAGSKTRKAVASISGKNVIIRYIKLPKMSAKEVDSTLKWDAEKYVPLSPGSDLVLEHLILGEFTENNTQQINVLLVAVPRRLVYLVNEVFTKADLTLIALEIEPLSLWRSVGSNVSVSTGSGINRLTSFIGLDIGAKASNLVVYQGESLMFSRYIPIGGDELTKGVATSLGLEFNTAQLIKERDGLLTNNAIENISREKENLSEALQESLFPLVDEVRRSIEYYRSQFTQSDPQAIILTGGTAKLKGITDFFQEKLNLHVILGLKNFTLKEEAEQTERGMGKVDPTFAVAVGLALREELA